MRAALLLAVVSLGCGPSVATLVQSHRVNEAFCRASNEEEAAMVAPLMLEQVATEWRVRRILASDLPELDPAFAHDLFEQYVILAPEVKTRSAIARHRDAIVSFSPKDPKKRDIALGFPPISPSDFAGLTGEATPAPKQVTETKLAHPGKAISWAFITLGVSLLFADRITTTSTQYPTDAELRAAAPKSAALYDAIHAHFGHVPIVVMSVGEGARRFTVHSELLIDNHDGALGPKCLSDMRATLESEPFELTASEPWPAGNELRRFGAKGFCGATFSHYPDSFHVR